MARVKRGTLHIKKRERLLKLAKGYKWRRKTHLRQARQALFKAWQYQYRDRRRDKRGLWLVRINAVARENGTTYGRLIADLHKANVQIDRKILADLALNEPKVFSKIVVQLRSPQVLPNNRMGKLS